MTAAHNDPTGERAAASDPRARAGHFVDRVQSLEPGWHRDGACREHPITLWFPESGQKNGPAKEICQRCLVLTECRAWAIADPTLDHGIFGGLTANERKAHRAADRRRARATTQPRRPKAS